MELCIEDNSVFLNIFKYAPLKLKLTFSNRLLYNSTYCCSWYFVKTVPAQPQLVLHHTCSEEI